MPNIDITRDATDLRKHYDRVQMQQGRVLTDDDFNEAERLDAEDARRVRVDVIGPAGSPDDGFRLKVVANNLTLTAGTYYVGGVRLELEADEAFNVQRDWLQQPPAEMIAAPPAGERYDFIWLEVWQQPVTAVEDKELIEAALGGADTSARVRTMRRARVLRNVGDVDCADAWAQLLAILNADGTINGDFELVPDARLTVEPDGSAGTADLCSPAVNGGYLGAENQAIRVQITGPNQFTWGFDNGAPLYRVRLLADGGGLLRRISMINVPKDQAHYPLAGQVVELLPWSALLFNGQKNAEQAGFLTTLNGGYNPNTQEVFLTAAPPPGFGQEWLTRDAALDISNEDPPEDVYFYMRVWNRGGDLQSPAVIPFAAAPVPLPGTGLQITFAGANLRRNDYWIIAVRPETPEAVVPWELSVGRRPHGVRRWLAPLGVVHWPGGAAPVEVVDDCRPTFLPLTRIKGCCTYTVGDGTHSFGNFSSIQAAVDALPPAGGKICVLNGEYDESVVIDRRVNIQIHGCGPRSRVISPFNPNAIAEPAFLITNSDTIAIEDLAIESGPRSAVQIRNSRRVEVRRCLIQMRDRATIWQAIYSRGDDVTIDGNIIEVLPREGGPPVPTVPPLQGLAGAPSGQATPPMPVTIAFATRGGIQLAGGSDRVKVTNNIIRGGIWNGITLGSLQLVGAPGDVDDEPDQPPSLDPCDPCRPPDLTSDDDPNNPGVRWVSAGDLYDIEIRGNTISDMGISGISVVRFFNLANGGDMIGVNGLHITDNFITRCMRRNLAVIAQAVQWMVAYGGIALARVRDLRVLRNEIVNNGANRLQPICGVYAITVQGLQLDDNRIRDNGAMTEEPVENAQNGIRGGVHVWIVTSLADDTIPACSMRDNIIVAPLGRAVTFLALGAVVVARNRLVTRGTTRRGLDLVAATVLIGNFGISNEWTLGLLQMLVLAILGKVDIGANFCEQAKFGGTFNQEQPPSLWPPLARYWSSGKTLVTENQVTLDVDDAPVGLAGLTSVAIAALDDLGFADNQLEITTTNSYFFLDAFLVANSVRMADNRLSETWMHAAFSAWTVGGMNTTTSNQSTHCILANAFLPGMRVFRDNLALLSVFCDDCNRD
jgi:Family of unknown function (DUF6519)